GSAYTDLNWEQQLALLQQLEKDPGKGSEFFALVRQHTMEGYYGDPKYGGNRNSVSWKMIGFKG
ncbi:MAG: gluconate 2-dehydrogenase subunit 3 family protein, partial [Acidobacteria bacterium]|nr:gluconate 2-dehydrogenase subunit 3 family protein [Acidobacteriota bacterium]